MTSIQTVPRGEHTAKAGDLYMSFELGDKRWKLSVGDGGRSVSRYTVIAGDKQAVADCIVGQATSDGGSGTRPQLLRGGPRRMVVASLAE